MKTAIVHDWLVGMRGGEAVLEAIGEIFPHADLFTLICDRSKISNNLSHFKIITSRLQKVPGIHRGMYRYFLPLFPRLIEEFDLSNYSLIISSSHCVAKGVKKPPGSVHISYLHSPMRYIWDRYEDYFGKTRSSFFVRKMAERFRPYLQAWDVQSSRTDRIDLLLANSSFISDQVQRIYQRKSTVIFPFVDSKRVVFPRNAGNHYLIVSGFAPNKRIDIAVEAFSRLGLPLIVVGTGQEEKKLRRIAGPTVQFLGWQTNECVAKLYSEARALVFPGIDDFGIAPVEAMAAGTPVIAYGFGGVLETVTAKTGIFFYEPRAESLMKVVREIETRNLQWSEEDCKERAQLFSRERFISQFSNEVQAVMSVRQPEMKSGYN